MTAAHILSTILLLVLVSGEAVRVTADTVRPGLREFSAGRHPARGRWLAARTSGVLLAVCTAVLLLPVLWALLT